MNIKKLKEKQGITLIALIITIIVLLILAGISIAMLAGDNGILTRTKSAKKTSEIAGIKEEIKTEIIAEQAGNEGNISEDALKAILEKHGTINYDEDGEKIKSITTKEGYEIAMVDIWTGTTISEENGVKIGEIFDETGLKEGKLHIGDFVNYTAGTWTQEDFNKIEESGAKISAASDYPQSNFQFGGFTLNSSKDNSSTIEDDSGNRGNYEIASDGTERELTGWRVFDVNGDMVTLISAGCPENYYHPGSLASDAYISEYILTGNKNTEATSLDLGLGTKYLKRDWSMYVNEKYKAINATAITKAKLDEWYTKYTNTASADTYITETFDKIYKSIYGSTNTNCINNGMYESLIDNGKNYWLSSAEAYGYTLSHVGTNDGDVMVYGYSDTAYGVRILVSLSSDVKFSKKSVGTKKVTSQYDNTYTYNVWNIQ